MLDLYKRSGRMMYGAVSTWFIDHTAQLLACETLTGRKVSKHT